MDKTLYEYDLKIKQLNENVSEMPQNIEKDIIAAIEFTSKKTALERREDYSDESKILYLDCYKYDFDARLLKICFKSAKYNARRHVIDTQTIKERGVLKNKLDGDTEKNHLAIKFYDDKSPICLFEKNYFGIGFAKIIHYINKCIKYYHKNLKDKIRYKIVYNNVVSTDFLKALEQLHRIKMVTLTVDREDLRVSDTKQLSGRADICEDVDIVLKPSGEGIFQNTVKDFYNLYNNPNRRVKKVTVNGDSNEHDKPIRFDTEQMKEKIIVNVSSDIITGEVKTNSIFEAFSEVMEGL